MTDREILEEDYHMAVQDKRIGAPDRFCNKVVSFIEQEWMKHDDKYNHPFHHPVRAERTAHLHNKKYNPKDWIIDAREMERHRGLEIGEDGTVKE